MVVRVAAAWPTAAPVLLVVVRLQVVAAPGLLVATDRDKTVPAAVVVLVVLARTRYTHHRLKAAMAVLASRIPSVVPLSLMQRAAAVNPMPVPLAQAVRAA